MSGDIPKISVVVPTYNRCDTLRKTLTCLNNQDLAAEDFEVILIDDGSPDATREVVAELIPTMRCATRYFRHENHGAGYTANRGLREARAPIVLLMADDIQMMPGTVREHLRAHQENPDRATTILGRVDQSPELQQTVFIRHWDPFQFRGFKGVTTLPHYMFWICNLSAKREFLLANKGFKETKGRAGGHDHADCEFGGRLRKDGLKILYNDKALAHHLQFETLDQAIARYHQRGLNWVPYAESAGDPEVNVAYHVLNRYTIKDHLRVFTGPNTLSGLQKNPLAHLVFHLGRALAFNGLTVPWIWRPLFDLAEKSPAVAKLMNRHLYRVFLFYHFIKGIRDARAKFGDRSCGGAYQRLA